MSSRALISPSASSGEIRAAGSSDIDAQAASTEAIRLMPTSSTYAGWPDPPYAGAGR